MIQKWAYYSGLIGYCYAPPDTCFYALGHNRARSSTSWHYKYLAKVTGEGLDRDLQPILVTLVYFFDSPTPSCPNEVVSAKREGPCAYFSRVDFRRSEFWTLT